MLRHYCVFTQDLTAELLQDLWNYRAASVETHLARTRFKLDVDNDSGHALLYVKYSHCIHNIDHELDHTLGR